jgi:hypothetical protein
MPQLKIISDKKAVQKFKSYPDAIKKKMADLRSLILEVARETAAIDTIEETLKWGEPSYITKKGTTLRIDWKEKSPNQYAMYFQCTSRMIPTIKALYRDTFKYETTRAILFDLEAPLPILPLKDCINMALTYHAVKHMPLLGR